MKLFRRRPLGERGERIAARHLRKQGYCILGRNVHLGRYEIDLIAREGDTIAFVEVKTRAADPLAPPEESVTPAKQRHIRAAAHMYIAQHDDPDQYYRFDVVAVEFRPNGKPEVTLYRSAFPDQP